MLVSTEKYIFSIPKSRDLGLRKTSGIPGFRTPGLKSLVAAGLQSLVAQYLGSLTAELKYRAF